jgi:flagellar motor protein MotB
MIPAARASSRQLETNPAGLGSASFAPSDAASRLTPARDDAGWLITLSDLTLLLLCFFIFLHVADRRRAAASQAAEPPAAIEATAAATEETTPAEDLPEPVTITFIPGKADLPRTSLAALEEVATLLENDPDLKLEIVGHTDDRPIATREFPTNWELSAARASGVARHFIDRGVAPGRLSVQSYAAFRPVSPNSELEGREANRRVEISFFRDE